MSSILEALRKLEEQKSARKPRPVDIADGVLRVKPPRSPLPLQPWQLGVGMAVLVVLSVSGTVLFMRRQPVLTPVAPTVAAPAAPVASTPSAVAAPPTVVVQKERTRPATAPLRTTDGVKPAPAAAARTRNAPESIPSVAPVQDIPPVPGTPAGGQPAPAVAEISAPAVQKPALKVTGIGWQKDAAARYAVINGSAVSEGGMVDGARVEEIMPEKVRLRVNGTTMEVSLGK